MAFQKGHLPWNKGVQKRLNTGKTHFKKGFPPIKHRPECECCRCTKRSPWAGKKMPESLRIKLSNSHKGIQSGEKHPNWKGGIKILGNGYIYRKEPNHPFAAKSGYIMEHRLVMEKHIGRYLKPEEQIHHINEIKTDNRVENLFLCKNNSEHLKIHEKFRTHDEYGKYKKIICSPKIEHQHCSHH